jgi:hypothetical protein
MEKKENGCTTTPEEEWRFELGAYARAKEIIWHPGRQSREVVRNLGQHQQ